MKLKSVIFYQGVKLWDNNMYATVLSGKNNSLEDVTITIEDHLVTLSCPKYPDVVIVGTSNMRCANATKEEVEQSYPEATELEAPCVEQVENAGAEGVAGTINGLLADGLHVDDPERAITSTELKKSPEGFDASRYVGTKEEPKVQKPAKAPGMSKAEKLAAAKKADKSS